MKNQEVNSGRVEIGFRFTNVDYVKKVCNVTVTLYPMNGDPVSVKRYRNARVSNLLSWSFKNNSEYFIIDHEYRSSMRSDSYVDNPIQMIKYSDKVTGDPVILFALVKEWTPKVTKIVGPTGEVITEYKDRYHKKMYYRRYRNYVKSEVTSNVNRARV
jgi:hypothetical protein